MSGRAGQIQGTSIGAIAVLLWATLALLTTWAAGIPLFQLLAMAVALAFAAGGGMLALRGRA